MKKQARTFLPEILAPGTGLSPTSPLSITPAYNVPTILDMLGGKSYKDLLPGGGGEWSSEETWGKDSWKNFKEDGDGYKRQERDLEVIRRVLDHPTANFFMQEEWKVKVPGGVKTFPSFESAQKYKQELAKKGIPISWMTRSKTASNGKRTELIQNTVNKTYMVESSDPTTNSKELGSAFCIAPNYFITCAHVVKKYDKNQISNTQKGEFQSTQIRLSHNGRYYPARMVSVNLEWDIALLYTEIQIEPFRLNFGTTLGNDVLVIGSPYGYENNLSFGTIGAVNRKVYKHNGAANYLFIDSTVFSGNSGGPVIDVDSGNIIGMVTAIITKNGEFGLNLALPAKYIKDFCSTVGLYLN
jgi:prepilin-type processing-associated H-X9-DG protein